MVAVKHRIESYIQPHFKRGYSSAHLVNPLSLWTLGMYWLFSNTKIFPINVYLEYEVSRGLADRAEQIPYTLFMYAHFHVPAYLAGTPVFWSERI